MFFANLELLLTVYIRLVPTLSLILLTHPTISHLGAYAHCCKHFPLFAQIPTYATNPVISLGRTLLQEIYASSALAPSLIPSSAIGDSSLGISAGPNNPHILLQPPTTDEIASYFSLINPLKYSQPHQPLPSPFSPPLNGLTITGYNAGHTLGGTIWHIQHGMESVVYAVDWNQVKESVLSGAAWLGGAGARGAEVIDQLRKPTALICSAKGVEKAHVGARTKRDELLLDMIQNTLSKDGTILVPTDSSARVLELAYLLEHAWREAHGSSGNHPFKSSKLYLASKTISSTMRYARGMVEWMDEGIVREYEAEVHENEKRQQRHRRTNSKQANAKQEDDADDKAEGPFDFNFLQLVEKKSKVEKLLSNKSPKVILASDTSLSWGFSRDVFMRIVDDPNNLIILTGDLGLGSNPPPDTEQSIAQTLWSWYQERCDGMAVDTGSGGQTLEQVHSGSRELAFTDANRVALEGKELVLYQQFLATQRQLQNTRTGPGIFENANDAVDDASSESSSSSDESEGEQQGKALNFSSTMKANQNKAAGEKEIQGVLTLLRKPGCYDWDVRGKKGREAIFPTPSKRRKMDEFGELIRPEDYLRAEERDEIAGQDMRNQDSEKINALGEKRKWADVQIANGITQRRSTGGAKRQRVGEGKGAAGGAQGKDDESSESSESEAEEIPSGPAKVVFESRTVQANLRIAYVDFTGLHGQRSLSNLIPLIQPRKIVLVGGTASETRWLADECRKKLPVRVSSSPSPSPSSSSNDDAATDDIFTPRVGETVTASMDTNAWTVALSRDLVRRLQWQTVRGLGVVTLTGRLAAPAPSAGIPLPEDARAAKRQKLEAETGEKGSKSPALEGSRASGTPQPAPAAAAERKPESEPVESLPPTLDVLPANLAVTTRAVAQPLHVGDLRLADLRRVLQAGGHAAEFRGEGTLVVDGAVAVRKVAGGQVAVEGTGLVGANGIGGGFGMPATRRGGMDMGEGAFHAVRRLIYEGLAIIAGG